MMNLQDQTGIRRDVSGRISWNTGFEALEPRQLLSLPVSEPGNTIVRMDTAFGMVYIELFDSITPITVNNFLNYVNRGDYDGSFFHRLVPGFVLQGGGFTYNEESGDGATDIPTDPPIVNEFNLPNVARTIAMAKTADPDSATSQFFFNLGDNTSSLDNPTNSGGFTVFGRVIGGWDVVLTMANLERVNFGGVFNEVPVTDQYDFANPPNPVPEAALVMVSAVREIGTAAPFLNGLSLGGVISAVSEPNGTLRIAGRASSPAPMALHRAADGTTYTASVLPYEVGAILTTSDPVTWIDPKDGRNYIAVPTTSGVALLTETAPGTWSLRNLNTEIPGLPVMGASLSVMTDPLSGLVYLAGLNSTGQLITIQQTGGTVAGGGYEWSFTNRTTAISGGGPAPFVFVGSLTTYTTPWGALNVVGLDGSGNIRTIWFAPELDSPTWVANNLSAIAGTPALTGRLSAFVTPWGAINISGATADGDVHVTWWTPDFGWISNNLTDIIEDAPNLQAATLSSYVTSWGGQNIVGLDADTGEIVVYWWTTATGWVFNTLADFITGTPDAPAGPLTGIAAGNGNISIFGNTVDNRALEYRWNNVTDTWSVTDLSLNTRLG